MKQFDYKTYLSPFTIRYGSDEMKRIWSEENKRLLWRKIWVALASAQKEQGLVTEEELEDLKAHQEEIDIEKAEELEKELKHDLMSEIKVFASQATVGGGKIHLGATSMDIEDNADTIRILESLTIIEKKLLELLNEFVKKITQYKDTACMGYTHLQPAEPTTVGYRFALYAQDLLLDLKLVRFVISELKGKGMKGAVGTAASYVNLVGLEKVNEIEESVMSELGLDSIAIASQTGQRKMESLVSHVLSSISESLAKFAFDTRLMQSPGFGEWSEPFGKKQVGSSAMPFKRNPIKSEQINSLARFVLHASTTLSDNSSHMLLERTLDDSANRRVVLPELFLAIDQILMVGNQVIEGLVINEKQIEKNLEKYGPFAATEVVMMTAVKNGADRQVMHEILRDLAMQSYEAMQNGEENPLARLLQANNEITKFVKSSDIEEMMNPKKHIGLAKEYCEKFLEELQKVVK